MGARSQSPARSRSSRSSSRSPKRISSSRRSRSPNLRRTTSPGREGSSSSPGGHRSSSKGEGSSSSIRESSRSPRRGGSSSSSLKRSSRSPKREGSSSSLRRPSRSPKRRGSRSSSISRCASPSGRLSSRSPRRSCSSRSQSPGACREGTSGRTKSPLRHSRRESRGRSSRRSRSPKPSGVSGSNTPPPVRSPQRADIASKSPQELARLQIEQQQRDALRNLRERFHNKYSETEEEDLFSMFRWSSDDLLDAETLDEERADYRAQRRMSMMKRGPVSSSNILDKKACNDLGRPNSTHVPLRGRVAHHDELDKPHSTHVPLRSRVVEDDVVDTSDIVNILRDKSHGTVATVAIGGDDLLSDDSEEEQDSVTSDRSDSQSRRDVFSQRFTRDNESCPEEGSQPPDDHDKVPVPRLGTFFGRLKNELDSDADVDTSDHQQRRGSFFGRVMRRASAGFRSTLNYDSSEETVVASNKRRTDLKDGAIPTSPIKRAVDNFVWKI